MNEPIVADILKSGSVKEVSEKFAEIGAQLNEMHGWLNLNRPKTDERLVLENLLLYASDQADRLGQWVNEPIDLIAWATRNLYESNLTVRHLLQKDDHFLRSVAERAKDEMEIYEGLIGLDGISNSNAQILKEKIQSIKAVAQKNGFNLSNFKLLGASDLARKVGMQNEHKSFYKFYSKYVHPSAWLMNASKDEKDCLPFRNVFWMQAQLYAHSTYSLIAKKVDFQS